MRTFITVSAVVLSAATAHAVCEGDFDGNRQVTVDELVTAVNNAATGCQMFGYIDNGDGTVTDVRTGLMWEQKVAGSGCLHCADDVYTWNQAMTDWIAEVNEYTVYEDWRIPSFKELRTLYQDNPGCGYSVLCMDRIFDSTTSREPYWTGTFGYDPPTDTILTLQFSETDYSFGGASKGELRPVRAVRGTQVGPR